MRGFFFQLFLLLSFLISSSQYLNYQMNIEKYLAVFIPWVLLIWLTRKNKPKYEQKKTKYVLAPFIRSYILMTIISLTTLIILGVEFNIIKYILIGLFSYYLAEYLIYYIIIINKSKHEIITKDVKIKKYIQKKFDLNKIKNVDISRINFSEIKLNEKSLKKLYPTNNDKLNGKYSINDLNKNDVDLLIMNENINNIKDVNKFLSDSFKIIKKGGHLIIGYIDLKDVEEKIAKQKGIFRFLKKIKYYIFDRAFPKLVLFNKIHSIISANKNKVLSKTEVWGRLIYNGFDVKNEIKEGDITYLIAQKDRVPSENPNPSYSPIIRLNRVGLYGEIIKIYKLRSMYPYSEFLQEKVYNMNRLSSTGKFSDDFRITKLGKIYRKYWIDELPQLLDWFRGSIKLVGIRAMSQQFFSLYSKKYQELYFQVKPGIISPIFDDKTDSFDAIQKIEQEYLEKYLKNPLATDIEYFFITLKHILKGVRSK